jgi:DNA-binding beta-propeller fold protein YncE
MEKISYEPWSPQPRRRRDTTAAFGAVIAVLIALGLIMFVLFPPIEGVKTGVPVSRKISTLNYPAALTRTIGQPVGGTWTLPTSAATLGDTTFVLDTGNNRILELDAQGRLAGTLVGTADGRLDLRQPMSIATDGSRLFVANSLAAEIVVLDPSGAVDRVMALEGQPGDSAPRPIGVAAGGDGNVIVSDAENHRVLILDPEGRTTHSFGTGTRAGGSQGLNVPAGLAVDAAGNIYVVDTLNGRIVKLSPEGEFIRDFSSLADTAGSLARPKGVAVDGAGRIFVSDGLQAAIEVFGPSGDYLGVIGRRDATDASAGSIFETPSGLSITGDRMTVVDGVLGLIVLQLPEEARGGSGAGG